MTTTTRPAKTDVISLPILKILTDPSTQARELIDPITVGEFAELLETTPANLGNPFPPLIVFRDDALYWLADGWHRLRAAQKVGWTDIECEVHAPSNGETAHQAATLYAAGANETHGKRRTPADRRRAVQMVIDVMTAKGESWSDREIARQAAVYHSLVSEIRAGQLDKNPTESRTGADGKTYDMAKRAAANDARKNARDGKPTQHSPNGHEAPLSATDNEGCTGLGDEPHDKPLDDRSNEYIPRVERAPIVEVEELPIYSSAVDAIADLKKFLTGLMTRFEHPEVARPAIQQALRELAELI